MENTGISKGKEDFVKARNYVMAVMDKAAIQEKEIEELQKEKVILQQKVNKLENDELCKVVNLESIAKYGLRQTNTQIVEVIVNMLNRLCVSKGCVPEPLRIRIEELEDHIIELKSHQLKIQHNHGCQNFFGNVTESDFHA